MPFVMEVPMPDGSTMGLHTEHFRMEPETVIGPGNKWTVGILLQQYASMPGVGDGGMPGMGGAVAVPSPSSVLPYIGSGFGPETIQPIALPPGADLRDYDLTPAVRVGAQVDGDGAVPPILGVGAGGTIGVSALLAFIRRFAPSIAGRLEQWAAGFTRGARVGWQQLPSWLKQALAILGVSTAFDVIMDLPGVPGPGLPGLGGGPELVMGVQVVGSWTANGVRFYRLIDGRLAVQNSKGRWKVWRPKRPIVIYAGGASKLTTMLKADAALNRQSKKVKKMLDRRVGGRPRSRAKPASMASEGAQVVNVK